MSVEIFNLALIITPMLFAVIAAVALTSRAKIKKKLTQLQDRADQLEAKYSGIDSLTKERENVSTEIQQLRTNYTSKHAQYEALQKRVAEFDDVLSFAEFGVYERQFDFDDSDAYKKAITDVRTEQKKMITDGKAIIGDKEWSVGGSKANGKKMVDKAIKMTLRAFNGDANTAINNTKWNNVNAMAKRIDSSRNAIDKLNASLQLTISDAYVDLKLRELNLVYEYADQLKIERDERAEDARMQKEEERLIKDADRLQKEEDKFQQMLLDAKKAAEADIAKGTALTAEQEQRIAELQQQLDDAHSNTTRTKAMAERTKSGFVYIISNVGSFGDNVIKIGMTRRLEPMDRVKELGDASVPFLFDVHALIYADNAPELENQLHHRFDEHRVNKVNTRKEFFHVSVDDVESALKELAPTAEFHRDVDAQEFKETIAKRKQAFDTAGITEEDDFPSDI